MWKAMLPAASTWSNRPTVN